MSATPEKNKDSSELAVTRTPRTRNGPLAGIRVTDFCWMGVGACATRLLADFGAEVIRIEDPRHLDMPRRLPFYKGGRGLAYGEVVQDADPNKGGLFNNYNRNKLGVTINMGSARGRSVVERLIATSSIVTENFAPGVMERWGLTYERLKQIRPDVIYARMSGFGHDGPHAEYRSYGPVVQAVSGLSYISGLPGEPPSGWGLSYMDNQAAYLNSAAILNAIFYRNRTGRGTEIDVSAVEAGIQLMGPIMLDVAVNARKTRDEAYPTGNRLEYPNAAPHGVYPSAGDDKWIAITIFDDAEWQRFVTAIGAPDWTSEPRFSTQESRFENQDALDEFVSRWTRERSAQRAMEDLQRNAVRAGAVQTAEDLNEFDPQIANRGLFFELDHPVIGPARFEGTPIHFSETRPDNWRSGPLLGEDNEYVLKHIVGVDDTEFDELKAEGVI